MLGDTVAIEVPPDAAPALVDRARRSCEAALGAGRCRMAHLGPVPEAQWRVSLTSEDRGRSLRIVLLSARDPLDVRMERSLEFKHGDPLERRWESAGAVIAALVAAQPEAQFGTEPAASTPPPVVVGDEPSPVRRPHPPWWAVDVGAVSGPGLADRPLRNGVLLRGWMGIGLPFVALIEARTTASSGNPGVTWTSGAAGFGGRFAARRVSLELSSAIIAQRMLIHASDGLGHRDSGALWRYGGRLGLDVAPRVGRRFDFLIGAETSVLRPGVTIELAGAQAGREPPVRWAGHLGLRFVPGRR